ncbi:VWA domain-containing protein [Streptomyces sp. NPDC047123]|uniref:VWA domain-containing protein n=1 Tax=Streptomyces sp. NPDC047123 TaxID=3155622 RepID=UPI0034072461
MGAAIGLRTVEDSAPALVSLYKSAGVSLRKHGLEGARAAVYLVVDHAGSMRPYDEDGSVQAPADRVLGLSAHLDDDGVVPTVFFSTDIDAGFFHAGNDPLAVPDDELYDRLVGEFPAWLAAARDRGIVA